MLQQLKPVAVKPTAPVMLPGDSGPYVEYIDNEIGGSYLVPVRFDPRCPACPTGAGHLHGSAEI